RHPRQAPAVARDQPAPQDCRCRSRRACSRGDELMGPGWSRNGSSPRLVVERPEHRPRPTTPGCDCTFACGPHRTGLGSRKRTRPPARTEPDPLLLPSSPANDPPSGGPIAARWTGGGELDPASALERLGTVSAVVAMCNSASAPTASIALR